MKLLTALLALALLGVGAFGLNQWEGRRRDAVAANAAVEIWQAKYATLASQAKPVADTVRVVSRKTETLRDSVILRKSDTVMVERFVRQVDTLRVACLRCAALLDTLRLTSDSTIHALRIQVEAVKPSWMQRNWLVPTVGGVLLGAWVRGQ